NDTDGDGTADLRETWFTGFAQENPQLRANHPTFALDNHIYVANGLRGGDVIARRPGWSDGAKPVSISGMDFRFDPLTGAYEAVSGLGQFGLTFDDFGRRFVCSNRNPCRHVVLENRYLKRNPSLAVPEVAHDVSPDGEDSRVFPLVSAWTTSTLHAGQFTAACGVTIYRGDALPAEFRGNSFTCEPTGSLVHRDVLSPLGATFTSRPGRKGTEFLASRDDWFRPVNLANGPDGALYVVDMYRAVIEHPQFMPEELKTRRDLLDGSDRGRIYRITSNEARLFPQSRASQDVNGSPLEKPGFEEKAGLQNASTADLVALLDHPNAWHRETAARLLYERQDAAAREPLERLAREGQSPLGRIHALWALEGIEQLSAETVKTALRDESPRVREQAVRLSERWLKDDAELRELVLDQSNSDDARLRFQVALSSGEMESDEEIMEALTLIVLSGAADPWTRAAVMSAVPDDAAQLFCNLLIRMSRNLLIQMHMQESWNRAGNVELVREMADLVGSSSIEQHLSLALSTLLVIPTPRYRDKSFRVQAAGLVGLERGMRRKGRSLSKLLDETKPDVREDANELFERAKRIASDRNAEPSVRQEALAVLPLAGESIAGPVLKELALSEPLTDVRCEAIRTWSRLSSEEIGPALLEMFPSSTPAVRRAILDALLADVERTRQLLAAMQDQRIGVMELEIAHVNRLQRHRDKAIRALAAKIIESAVSPDRAKIIDQYAPALESSADARHGRELFAKNCASCHKIGEVGVNVAPDIADTRTKTPAQLLTDILDPNRAVDNNYFAYTVVTTQGRTFTGLVVTETPTSVTLKEPDAKTHTILREEIELMKSNGVSLMPLGFEQKLSPREMADLVSFLKNWRYLDGQVPIDVSR
ncbi:MAG: PVC-type heme-binding CxxCH protein, partial [Planctomycetaceae bacterium]